MHTLTSMGIASVVLSTPLISRAQSFIIGETTDFTGNGPAACTNADLNNVGAALRDAVLDDGWSGVYFMNSSSWPQDYRDPNVSAGGLDGSLGDHHILSVYAGHGNVNLLQWGFPHDGACTNNIQSTMRLGTQAGDTAAYLVYLTSCTAKVTSSNASLFQQQAHQQFGYHNSPSIGDDQAAAFFEETDTGGLSNRGAWLEEMEDKPGWGTGDNSPRAITFSKTSEDDCWSKHFSAQLKAGTFLGSAPEPHQIFCSQMRDHGTSATCAP